MSRFNIRKSKKAGTNQLASPNLSGGKTYIQSNEVELTKAACCTFMEDQFYESSGETAQWIAMLVDACDPIFVCQLATYLRREQNLRSVPIYLLALLAKGKTPDGFKFVVARTLQRMDEPGELLMACMNLNGGLKRNVPRSVLKGIALYLTENLNAYNAAKYKGSGRGLSLRDVLRITHPKPRDAAQGELFASIIARTLAPAETWEVSISANGSSAKSWNEVAPRMGIFALARNLRNFLQHDAQKAIDIACAKLADADVIASSKMMPFRFVQAAQEVDKVEGCSLKQRAQVQRALEMALQHAAVRNMPQLAGKVACFTDLSGSMFTPVSAKSSMKLVEIGTLFSAALYAANAEVLVGAFGESYRDANLRSTDSVVTNAEKLMKLDVGHATYGHLTLQRLIDARDVCEHVVIFTDCELYRDTGRWSTHSAFQEAWATYKKIAPNAKLYVFNLAAYPGTPVAGDQRDVYLLSGWSDGALRLFKYAEEGFDAMVNHIKRSYMLDMAAA